MVINKNTETQAPQRYVQDNNGKSKLAIGVKKYISSL